jgi:hypothetical protein
MSLAGIRKAVGLVLGQRFTFVLVGHKSLLRYSKWVWLISRILITARGPR